LKQKDTQYHPTDYLQCGKQQGQDLTDLGAGQDTGRFTPGGDRKIKSDWRGNQGYGPDQERQQGCVQGNTIMQGPFGDQLRKLFILSALFQADRTETASSQIDLTEAADKTAATAADLNRLFVRVIKTARLPLCYLQTNSATFMQRPQDCRKQFNL
jgi:hypothetical protein